MPKITFIQCFKPKYLRIVLTVCFFIIVPPSFATKTSVTYFQLIKQTVKNSDQIKAGNQEIESKIFDLEEKKAAYYPKAVFQYTLAHEDDRLLNDRQYHAPKLDLSYDLYSNERYQNKLFAKENIRLSRVNKELIEHDFAFQLADLIAAYYQGIAIENKIRQNNDSIRKQVEAISKRITAGSATNSELNQALSQLYSGKASLKQARSQRMAVEGMLNGYLIPIRELDIRLPKIDFLVEEWKVKGEAQEYHGAKVIKKLYAQVQVLKASDRVQDSKDEFKVSLKASHRNEFSFNTNQFPNDRDTRIFLNFELPLYDGFRARKKTKAVKAQISSLNSTISRLKREHQAALNGINSQIHEEGYAVKNFLLAEREASQVLRDKKQLYKKGNGTIDDILQAEKDLLNYQMSKIRSEFNVYRLRLQYLWKAGYFSNLLLQEEKTND